MTNDHPTPSHINGIIGPLNKGLGPIENALSEADIARLEWNLLNEDLSLPAAVLYEDKLKHNLHWMQSFVEAYGMKLAPHGKTTMAPKLFQMQLDAGAWGITLATAQQVKVAYAHGVRRVLMANQIVGKQNMAIIGELLRDPEFEFYCLVDSAENLRQLAEFFSNLDVRLGVLIELGVAQGRTGVRDDEQLNSLITELSKCGNTIALCGIEVYEGVLSDEQSIRDFLKRAIQTLSALVQQGRFQHRPILLSGAGSAWYDVVAEEFFHAQLDPEVQAILRPGCYLTHDAGAYCQAQARILNSNPVAQQLGAGLVTALHIWAYVQSIPEPGRAIIGMGKRDVAFDSGLPVPVLHIRPGNAQPVVTQPEWKLTKIMDQHAFMEIQAGDDVRIGDMIAFDISHPCLTFDKWRTLPILNAEFKVIDIMQTFF